MSLCLYLFFLHCRHIQYNSKAFIADVATKVPSPLNSKASLPQSEVIWVQLCGGNPSKTWRRCLSIFFFVQNIWQVVAWDTCSRINLQGLVVYEKHPPLCQSALCSQFTHRSKLFEPNSGSSLIISEFPWTRRLQDFEKKLSEETHLFLLIVCIFIVPPSPRDPTSVPSSSFSNHALIVQRDTFFILAYEILKRLRNMCSAMQT